MEGSGAPRRAHATGTDAETKSARIGATAPSQAVNKLALGLMGARCREVLRSPARRQEGRLQMKAASIALAVVYGALALACSNSTPLDPPPPPIEYDGGAQFDGGDVSDGGVSDDGGTPEDGGPVPDGGSQADGGPVVDGGPTGSGATATQNLGPAGGMLQLASAQLIVPAGALAQATDITITELVQAATPGFERYSPVYEFQPNGQSFAQPLTVRLPFTGNASNATLFWSRAAPATGYERLPTRTENGVAIAQVTHFSHGFVANGVEYQDPPDRSCARTAVVQGRLVGGGTSGVALFFTVDDCNGNPITGLANSDFTLWEDEPSQTLSVESEKEVLQKDGLQVFITLLLDMSSSTRLNLAQVIAGAHAFVTKLLENPNLPATTRNKVQIAIQLFDGASAVRTWQTHTLDPATLHTRLNAIATEYQGTDPSSTNLNGAVVAALTQQASAKAAFEQRNLGGAFTTGYVVAFTDGRDTAGLATSASVRDAKLRYGDAIHVVGLQGPDYDAAALARLASVPRAMGGDLPGLVIARAEDPARLATEFANVANRIAGQISRIYLLGYCSPKRSGQHTVGVGLRGARTETVASYTFPATGFGPGCSALALTNTCPNPTSGVCGPYGCCGGLGCGACDDRVAQCDATTKQCVSFCKFQGKCRGERITNARGYSQACTVSDLSPCGATACYDLTRDARNCGACGVQCDVVASCIASVCQCPTGLRMCDGTCSDLSSDYDHCGACTAPCGSGMRCADSICSIDHEWVQWSSVDDSVAPSAFSLNGAIALDTRTQISWSAPASPQPSRSAARAYCAALGAGWRLPTLAEVISIYDYATFALPARVFSVTTVYIFTSTPVSRSDLPLQSSYFSLNVRAGETVEFGEGQSIAEHSAVCVQTDV